VVVPILSFIYGLQFNVSFLFMMEGLVECFHLVFSLWLQWHFRIMNFNNVRVPKVPGGGATSALLKVGIVGGLVVYAAANSLYTVEGGHRAIVFNRLVGVKDKVILFAG
jgi:hypothetical protein